jgi:L-cystine uptake protein TcyP (sodium:dicarboxylate symporter family)
LIQPLIINNCRLCKSAVNIIFCYQSWVIIVLFYFETLYQDAEEKMKPIVMSLMIPSILVFGLSGCSTGASIPQQITSLKAGCKSNEVRISNYKAELNGTEIWTAKCAGKTYYCKYLEESGADCYELDE